MNFFKNLFKKKDKSFKPAKGIIEDGHLIDDPDLLDFLNDVMENGSAYLISGQPDSRYEEN